MSGSRPAAKGDYRAAMPRFTREAQTANDALVGALTRLAAERGLLPAQLAIAWVLAKSGRDGAPTIVPTMGARTRAQLDQVLAALEVRLTPEEIATLEAAIPPDAVAGARYSQMVMAHLDSER